MPPPQPACVALIPSARVLDTGFEAALAELARRGCAVWRARDHDPPPDARDRLARDALSAGFAEFLFLDPAVVFDPADVGRLRSRGLPLVCGLYPLVAARSFACEFLPGADAVALGRGGGVVEVAACGLGFSLVRRAVLDALAGAAPYFAADPGAPPGPVPPGDAAFCRRARAAGFAVRADASVRLWHVGPYRYGWEDTAGDRPRSDSFTLRAATDPALPPAHPEPPRSPLRGFPRPLPPGFPRVRAFVVTYPANADSLAATLASVRASDWGEEPAVVPQPAGWPTGRVSGTANYRRALEAAAADGCDFALVLEDDVRVNCHLRHNLLANPLVRRDGCDYLGLFVPDLIADPWERSEPRLGYRLARPRYTGPDSLWERNRVWGSQAILLSRRLVLAALGRWDRSGGAQDARVLAACAELGVPLWYALPCLAEHAPRASAFGTPDAYAPDFDPDFRLGVAPGFGPPEEVPGWLTRAEGELLFRTAAGLDVLELGTASGRSTACLGQSARRVVSVDVADQSEAAAWAARFGVAGRVEFRRGDAGDVCRTLRGPFGLAFIDTLHDAASVARDIASSLPLLAPGGLLAFHDYPDPGWPDVRRVVDEHARRLGWKRVAQADFLGVFRTG